MHERCRAIEPDRPQPVERGRRPETAAPAPIAPVAAPLARPGGVRFDVVGRIERSAGTLPAPPPAGSLPPGRIHAAGVIQRAPSADESWKPGWGWGGKWTEDDVAKEFRKINERWVSAKSSLDGLKTVLSKLRSGSQGTFAKEVSAAEATVQSWDRKVSWSERTAALAALDGAVDSIAAVRLRADARKLTDDEVTAKEAGEKDKRTKKHDALMAEQQAAKRKKIADAEKAERERVAEEERVERERVASEEQDRQTKQEEARRRAAEEEAERKRKKEEAERKAKEDRQRAGRQAWDAAVAALAAAVAIDANAVSTMPDRFGSAKLRVIEVEKMLATERLDIDGKDWELTAVTAVVGDQAALKARWDHYVLAAAHDPRKKYEEMSVRTGSPITRLGIDAAKLWRFLGYPDAHGRDYAMPKFKIGLQQFHYSLTGNSMHDLSVLWNADKTILAKHPEEIFTALFVTGIRADRRIHITRESVPPRHVYLGGINGDGDPIPDHKFDGDAAAMKQSLLDLRAEFVAKLWEAKSERWVLR